jgi:hypothetical protein
VIRGVILHLNNEQPLLADLYAPPEASDLGLRCTNLRMMNGKRPVFVDDSNSIFFFPYLHIRFVEIPPAAVTRSEGALVLDEGGKDERAMRSNRPPAPEPEVELEIDEDLMRRIREV